MGRRGGKGGRRWGKDYWREERVEAKSSLGKERLLCGAGRVGKEKENSRGQMGDNDLGHNEAGRTGITAPEPKINRPLTLRKRRTSPEIGAGQGKENQKKKK